MDGTLRDFVVAARELSPSSLQGNQTDWINKHTVYTHGNGFVAAYANQVTAVSGDTQNNTAATRSTASATWRRSPRTPPSRSRIRAPTTVR